jgi:hypothetical protein
MELKNLHPLTHLAWYYSEHGNLETANRLQETMAERLVPVSDEPDWRGVIIYNLACHHALTGQKEQALDGLRRSMELYPGLKDWSQQDPDLNSLRQEPDYLKLYTE